MEETLGLHKAAFAWKTAGKQDQRKTEELYRKVRSILNKLTPQKFQTLVKQMSDLEINTEEKLKGVTDLVFEKVKVPSQTRSGDVNFRAILLTRCQREFEEDWEDKLDKIRKEISENSENEELKTQLEIEKNKDRKRSIGNIRFIGELFKLKMLTENIIHDCVFKLLRTKGEISLECVCQLLFTTGKELDTDKAKHKMDQYFNQMEKLVSEKETSSRVRFKLKDVIELRLNKWVPKREENTPKTIDQIRKDAQKKEQAEAPQKAKRGMFEGGQRCRVSRGPPFAGPLEFNPGSNTVGKQNIKFERLSIDPSRFKFSQQNPGGSAIQPDGGVCVNRFAVENTDCKKNTKFEKLTIDPSRLKFLKQTLDESTIQIDGGVDVNRSAVSKTDTNDQI